MKHPFTLLLCTLLWVMSCAASLAEGSDMTPFTGTWATADETSVLVLASDGSASLRHADQAMIYTWSASDWEVRLFRQTTALAPAAYNGFTLKLPIAGESLVFRRISGEETVDPTALPIRPAFVVAAYDDTAFGDGSRLHTLRSGWPIMRDLQPGMSLEVSYLSNDHTMQIIFPDAAAGETIFSTGETPVRQSKMYLSYETIVSRLGENKEDWGMRMLCGSATPWMVTCVRLVDTAAAEAAVPGQPLCGHWQDADGLFHLVLNGEGYASITRDGSVARLNWTRQDDTVTLIQSGIPLVAHYAPDSDTLTLTHLGTEYLLFRQ